MSRRLSCVHDDDQRAGTPKPTHSIDSSSSPSPDSDPEPLSLPGLGIQAPIVVSSPQSAHPHAIQFFLPIPAPSHSKSPVSYTFADACLAGEHQGAGSLFDPLPPEIAAADIFIAPDGSFVETSSGPAARELKRRFDQHCGVGKDVRSPYAITAFVNQHGRQMYRVGHKELSAPGAAAAEVEELVSAKSASHTRAAIPRPSGPPAPRHERSSRMSVHTLLHKSTFKHGAVGSGVAGTSSGTASVLPVPASAPAPTRKLRRTNSIPERSAAGADVVPPPHSHRPQQSHGGGGTTARGHSYSVTAADAPHIHPAAATTTIAADGGLHRSVVDVFADVMQWSVPSSPSAASQSSRFLHPSDVPQLHDSITQSSTPVPGLRKREIVVHPFGPGVTFDSPVVKSPMTSTLATPQQNLRVMHSFESGLTARQAEDDRATLLPDLSQSQLRLDVQIEQTGDELGGFLSQIIHPDSLQDKEAKERRMLDESFLHKLGEPFKCEEQPGLQQSLASKKRLDLVNILGSEGPQKAEEPSFGPSPETSMYSRYSTEVYDMLQTYRGLPQLDKLDTVSGETTVIKMSAFSDETAAPKDDPRFVIWGEMHTQHDGDDASVSLESGPSSVRSSDLSKSRRGKTVPHVDVPSLRVTAGEGSRKVMVAATIERWIAQLTSDLNYDELLNFFLTYRTYVTAMDLCHSLICRFHWALSKPKSPQDERVKRIVRVRTFVAFRYWLLTFFVVDFLGNRELRLWLAGWLNTLIKDPVLRRHSDGLSTVRKLKKVVKDCKKAHTRTTDLPSANKPRPKVSHVLGEKFAEATRPQHDDDSDIDLDFVADADAVSLTSSLPGEPVNAHLTAHLSTGLPPVAYGPALTILKQSKVAVIPSVDASLAHNPATFPVHHNALSRAFVNTIGRLGRWKRVLNSFSANRTPLSACADVSAFDLELTVSRDFLSVGGDVEQYLKMIEPESAPPLAREITDLPVPLTQVAEQPSPTTTAESMPTIQVHQNEPPASSIMEDQRPSGCFEAKMAEPRAASRPRSKTPPRELDAHEEDEQETRSDRASSSSTGSLGVPIASRFMSNVRESQRAPWQFDVVSIDDLDLSDTSSDAHHTTPIAPHRLRKTGQKRLPLRRDFEFVKRPESVSSMGIASQRRSVVSGASSIASASAPSSMVLGGDIQQWQVNALIDSLSNDEEAGDVENALRRLEGQISPAKQKEKASKVDVWVRTIRERLAAGDYHDEMPRFMDDDDDDDFDEARADDESPTRGKAVAEPQRIGDDLPPSSVPWLGSRDLTAGETVEGAITPAAQPASASPVSSIRSKPVLEDVVPIEILQSRLSARPQTSNGLVHPITLGITDLPQIHQSFILNFRAELLVQHFSMIDRELFMNVRFEELVLEDWMNAEETNVLDWAQFLKDRARWKAEHRNKIKTSALAAVRARFNLMANFTISEIVLTHPSQRALIVAKFIRIAFRAYSISNFHTLVAIIAALRSEWVTKAMRRHWNRVGIWETRMFTDLSKWTTNAGDFKYIRLAIESMVDPKPLDHTHRASLSVVEGQSPKSKLSDGKAAAPAACIPFIGVYLSQLHHLNSMPDLIDPTAPNEEVSVDPTTASFNPPAHPEVFASLTPLPASTQLEPLINVHKQRLIAGVIKSLVAGQHLASRMHFPVDKKLFQRCLRLRGLDTDLLRRALAMHPG